MKPPVAQPDLDQLASAPLDGDLTLTHLWHAVPAPDAFDLLRSRPDGLTSSEARKRLERYGPNELQEARRISPWQILLEQFKNVLILLPYRKYERVVV
jgi:magnesium-transporting ATPase (P-type)